MSAPSVSIIVPCRNYGRFLSQALGGLLDQSIADLEVIVIDDASTDDSPAVAQAFGADPRVRVLLHQRNIGHLATYNEGLALARGSVVGLLSADDLMLDRDALAKQLQLFAADPAVGLVYAGHVIVHPDGEREVVLPSTATEIREGRDEFARLMWGNYITHSGTLLRAEVARALGPYDLRLPHTGDWDMWLRAAARGRVGYVAEPLYGYRMHGVNMRHRSISPAHAARESVFTLQRGLDALRPADRAALASSVVRAVDHALLQNAWFDLTLGHHRRTLAAALYAIGQRPRVLRNGELWRLVARIALAALVGRRRYRRASSWRRSRRARLGEIVAGQ